MPFLSPTDQSRRHFDSSSVIAHPVNFDIHNDIAGEIVKCDTKNSTSIYIYRYYPLGNRYGFSISVQTEIRPLFIFFPMLKKTKFFQRSQVCDWLAKWLIMLGFMDLRRLRVVRRSNVGLYPNDSETGIFNLFNETHGKKSFLRSLRLQELKCHLYILNSIHVK